MKDKSDKQTVDIFKDNGMFFFNSTPASFKITKISLDNIELNVDKINTISSNRKNNRPGIASFY